MAYGFAAITGATSGIGDAFARLLPDETSLLLTDRGAKRLAEAKAMLARPGRRVETIAADLATEAGRSRFIAAAESLPIDLLINNAGLGRLGPIAYNPAAIEREIAEVNVVALVTITRALLPGMLARAAASSRRAGLIIVASAAAFQPMPFLATYGATKAFGLSYAEALAGELGHAPIDVLALCPGWTATAFLERAGIARSSFARLITAERVAREGLSALGRRTVHVVGRLNRLGAALIRFAPRRAAVARTRRIMKRRLPPCGPKP